MTEPPDQQADDGDAKPLLGYRSGIDERKARPRVPVWLQMLLGFLGGSSILWLAGFFGAIASDGHPAGFLVVLLVGATLVAIAVGMSNDANQRGWKAGLLVGAGFTGLLQGICFLTIF